MSYTQLRQLLNISNYVIFILHNATVRQAGSECSQVRALKN